MTDLDFSESILSRHAALLAAIAFLFWFINCHAERAVTLNWNPAPIAGTTGYFVYCQEEGDAAPVRLDVGNTTRATLSGLKEGLNYTFRVSANLAGGAEVPAADTLALAMPTPIQLVNGSTTGSYKRLRFPVAPGRAYEVQASTNLTDWSTFWQTGTATSYTWIEVPDLQSARLNARWYRLRIVNSPAR